MVEGYGGACLCRAAVEEGGGLEECRGEGGGLEERITQERKKSKQRRKKGKCLREGDGSGGGGKVMVEARGGLTGRGRLGFAGEPIIQIFSEA